MCTITVCHHETVLSIIGWVSHAAVFIRMIYLFYKRKFVFLN